MGAIRLSTPRPALPDNRRRVSLDLLFASEVLRKVDPGHCTFLSDGSRFMYNDWIGHSNSAGLRTCRNINPFNTSLV